MPTNVPGVDVPTTSKSFIPLENNPEVMTSLVHNLGLSPSLCFHDVFSISDPDLLSFVPRPATALLLVFPVSHTYERYRESEDAALQEYTGSGSAEEVMWFRQTIRNSCGLMGLLHAVSNGGARELIEANSDLEKLLSDAISLSPKERADLLYNSSVLEAQHGAAARQGQSKAPELGDDVDLHYVCFVKNEQTGALWELDGRRKGPLKRGTLAANEDVLSERALDLGPRKFMKREEEAGGGEMRFSLVALGPSLD